MGVRGQNIELIKWCLPETRFSKWTWDERVQNREQRLGDWKTNASARVTDFSADWTDEEKTEGNSLGKEKERVQGQGYQWIVGERELNQWSWV